MSVAVPEISAPSDDEAVVTSDCVAREPLERPAPVRVRVADAQMSAASVPNDERVRLEYAHTFAGIEVIEDAREVEAERTAALVLLLTDEVMPPVAEFVFALTTAAIEVDAVVTVAFTLDVALLMSLLVASEPVVRPAPVRVRVA